MKSAFWRTLAVAAIVLMPNLAAANDATIGSEAATSAMAGSTLNNTTALFNAWPHKVVFNGNGAEISTSNFSTPMNAGMGKVWAELYDDLWVNLNVGRMDLGTQAANFLWGGPVTNGFSISGLGDQTGFDATSNPWINLGIAKPGANGSAWSVNAFFAGEGFENEAADPTYKNSASGFGALVSWGNGDGLDVSAEFASTTETNEQNDPQLEGTAMAFSANARYDTDMYIYQGSVVFANGTEQVQDGTNTVDEDTSFLGVLANAGRFLKNEADGQTSIEFVFAFASGESDDATDPANVVTTETSAMVIPGVRVAAWEQINSWFGLMGGFQSVYVIDAVKDANTTTGLDYYWTAGCFAQLKDNVRVDVEFNPAGLNDFLSWGNTTPMVAYLGATVGLN